MNTDDFTTAREETAEDAADLWTRQQGYAMTGTEWGAFEQGHLTGTAWARDHLAAHDARVRRDAAREALADVVAHLKGAEISCAMHGDGAAANVWRVAAWRADHFRNTHYPKETP